MLRMLEIAFRHHAIPTAGRVTPKLEVFFEKLLRRATQPQIRPVRVKNVVPVERLGAARTAATPATLAKLTAPTITVTAPAAHALYVHLYCVSLFHIRHFRRAAGLGPGSRPEFRVCCIQTAPKELGKTLMVFQDQGGESNFLPSPQSPSTPYAPSRQGQNHAARSTRARGTPPRSARQASGVRPATLASAATAACWPAPNSNTATPRGTKSRGRSAMMRR